MRTFLVMLLALTMGANAGTWHVSTDSLAKFDLLQNAVNAAAFGDTIYAAAGTCPGIVTVDKRLVLIGNQEYPPICSFQVVFAGSGSKFFGWTETGIRLDSGVSGIEVAYSQVEMNGTGVRDIWVHHVRFGIDYYNNHVGSLNGQNLLFEHDYGLPNVTGLGNVARFVSAGGGNGLVYDSSFVWVNGAMNCHFQTSIVFGDPGLTNTVRNQIPADPARNYELGAVDTDNVGPKGGKYPFQSMAVANVNGDIIVDSPYPRIDHVGLNISRVTPTDSVQLWIRAHRAIGWKNP